mgnify:CR=1 FL=1
MRATIESLLDVAFWLAFVAVLLLFEPSGR